MNKNSKLYEREDQWNVSLTEKRSDNTKKRKASLKGFNARVKETENNGFKSHKISNLDNGKVERRK